MKLKKEEYGCPPPAYGYINTPVEIQDNEAIKNFYLHQLHWTLLHLNSMYSERLFSLAIDLTLEYFKLLISSGIEFL